jgi:hypothetical protein
MKCKMLLTLGLFAAAVTTFARIGDTYIQSTNRFGKALGHFKDKYAEVGLFEYKGYVIFVRYRKGKSFEESYVFLAPGVKSKIKKEEYWEDIFAILNDPENLTKMTEKQRRMLRSANLKTTWKFKKIKPNGIEEQEAILGKRKVSGNYYIARKVLVITNETAPPSPKASVNEIKQAKSMCQPLGSSFKQCMDKYGTPYNIWAPKRCYFQKSNYLLRASFVNKNIKNAISSGALNDSIQYLLKGMYGGTSIKQDYMILDKKAVSQYKPFLKTMREEYYNYRDKKMLNEDEETLLLVKQTKVSLMIFSENLLSLRSNIVKGLLEGTSLTKWQLHRRRSIHEIMYSTWKNGRRWYGAYDIIRKKLTIEFGVLPSDFKPDVIKKFKEKKATEALDNF